VFYAGLKIMLPSAPIVRIFFFAFVFHSIIDTQTWLTIAHEIGHNFGAQHTFQEGQGTTGGIMDYGDGKYQGIYQVSHLMA
jgi:hypothetical protein